MRPYAVPVRAVRHQERGLDIERHEVFIDSEFLLDLVVIEEVRISRQHGIGRVPSGDAIERHDIHVVGRSAREMLDVLQKTPVDPLEACDKSRSVQGSTVPQKPVKDGRPGGGGCESENKVSKRDAVGRTGRGCWVVRIDGR